MTSLIHLLPALTSRFSLHRAPPVAQTSSLVSRVEVCPPELWPSSATLWGRTRRWVGRRAPWLSPHAKPADRLERAKEEFRLSLAGVDSFDAQALAACIERARTLRELWHLRSTLYGVVAVARCQAEAERRLGQLNRHFTTRAPRSVFSALNG